MHFLIIILLAAILYMIEIHYFGRHWNHELSAEVSYNKEFAQIGDTVELIETIENRKAFPIPVLYLKYKTANSFKFTERENSAISDYCYRNDIFSVLGRQQVTRKLHFTPMKRGYFPIDSLNLVSNDLFIRQSFACVKPNFTELYVYPKRLSGKADLELVKTITGDIITNSFYEEPLSFKGLREYTHGDEMRRINWKATAKNAKLMVNTYFDSQNRDITLVLNFNTEGKYRPDRIQEQIIRVAATIVTDLISKGFHVGILSNAIEVVTGNLLKIEGGSGQAHLHTLLKGLAATDISGGFEDFVSVIDNNLSDLNKKGRTSNMMLLSNYCRSDLLSDIKKKQSKGYPISFVYIDTADGFRENKYYVNQPVSNTYRWEVSIDEAKLNIV